MAPGGHGHDSEGGLPVNHFNPDRSEPPFPFVSILTLSFLECYREDLFVMDVGSGGGAETDM
jgi:hypothetical protein